MTSAFFIQDSRWRRSAPLVALRPFFLVALVPELELGMGSA